jgi:hypothetical protein
MIMTFPSLKPDLSSAGDAQKYHSEVTPISLIWQIRE